MRNNILSKVRGLFKKHPALFLIVLFMLAGQPAFAWITSLNGRLDHSLYDSYEPRTVVHVLITGKIVNEAAESRNANICIDWYRHETGTFRIRNTIMGHDSLQDRSLIINTSSFEWPEDLVTYEKNNECILVLDYSASERKYHILTVVPVHHQSFSKTSTNRDAVLLLEKEILAALENEKDTVRQCEMIKQVAPVLSRENAERLKPYANSRNKWLSRASLAAMAYATEEEKIIRLLAADIEDFFSQHNEDMTIGSMRGIPGYAPYPYYYQHVFFLESGSMRFGTRWDEKEADRNLRIYNKLIDTKLISEKVRKLLEK